MQRPVRNAPARRIVVPLRFGANRVRIPAQSALLAGLLAQLLVEFQSFLQPPNGLQIIGSVQLELGLDVGHFALQRTDALAGGAQRFGFGRQLVLDVRVVGLQGVPVVGVLDAAERPAEGAARVDLD